jgi:tetratricopeptide (TPR) repeat protein
MAGILAWLAFLGAQTRAKLARTFWVDAPSGRNNLRQAMFKLRQFDLFSSLEPLALSPQLEIQAVAVLLEGLDYSDCPVFEEWLLAHRALEETKQLSHLEQRVQRLVQDNKPTEALEAARTWGRLEPLSEEALRIQVRLLAQMGELSQALALHQDFAKRLNAEWNLLPSPETQALFKQLMQAQAKQWQAQAQQLEQQKQFSQAAECWQQAALYFSDRLEALFAWHKALNLLLEFAGRQEIQTVVQKIEQHSQNPEELAQAALARAKCAYAQNDFALAARAARLGLNQTKNPESAAALENEQASALLRLDRIPEAVAAHKRALGWLTKSQNTALKAATFSELALAQASADLHPQAQANFHKADALYAQLGGISERVTLLGNLAMSQRMQGDSEAALGTLLLAQTIHQGSSGTADEQRYLLANRGEIYLWREEYRLALADLQAAHTISQKNAMPMSFVWFRLAHLYVWLGAFELAHDALHHAEHSSGVLERGLAMAELLRARMLRFSGADPSAHLHHAATLLEGRTLPSLHWRIRLERLAHQPNPTEAQTALQAVQQLGLSALEPLAWLRLAQATQDVSAAQSAWNLLRHITPMDCTKLELALGLFELGQPVKYAEDLRRIPPEFLETYQNSFHQQRFRQLTPH